MNPAAARKFSRVSSWRSARTCHTKPAKRSWRSQARRSTSTTCAQRAATSTKGLAYCSERGIELYRLYLLAGKRAPGADARTLVRGGRLGRCGPPDPAHLDDTAHHRTRSAGGRTSPSWRSRAAGAARRSVGARETDRRAPADRAGRDGASRDRLAGGRQCGRGRRDRGDARSSPSNVAPGASSGNWRAGGCRAGIEPDPGWRRCRSRGVSSWPAGRPTRRPTGASVERRTKRRSHSRSRTTSLPSGAHTMPCASSVCPRRRRSSHAASANAASAACRAGRARARAETVPR